MNVDESPTPLAPHRQAIHPTPAPVMADTTHHDLSRSSGSEEDVEKGGSTDKGPIGTRSGDAQTVLNQEVAEDEAHVSLSPFDRSTEGNKDGARLSFKIWPMRLVRGAQTRARRRRSC
jgi:hypothetical protein